MTPAINLQSDPIDQVRSRIDALKSDVADLQSRANAATEAVRRVGAQTRSEVTSFGRGGGHGGAAGHSGGVQMAHHLHALLMGRGVSPGTVSQLLRTGAHMPGAIGTMSSELLAGMMPMVFPAMIGMAAGHSLIHAFQERTKIQTETASAQLRTANFAWDAQYEVDKQGAGDDFFGLRRDAANWGRQRNTAKMSFMEKAFTFQTTIDAVGEKAGAEYALRVMERMQKAQKLFGGTIQDLDKHYGRYAADNRFFDREVKTAFDLKQAERESFLLHPINWVEDHVFTASKRRADIQLQRDIADDVIDKDLAREEARRKREVIERETFDPSFRAINKQQLEYFRIVEENTHTQRMEWSPV